MNRYIDPAPYCFDLTGRHGVSLLPVVAEMRKREERRRRQQQLVARLRRLLPWRLAKA